MLRALLLRIAVALLLACGTALAQSTSDALLSESERRIESIRERLKTVQSVLGAEGANDDEILRQKAAIESLQLDAVAERKRLAGPLSEVQEQLTQLGPAPQQGATEAAAMASQRRILDARLSRLQALQTQVTLFEVEADQSVTRIIALQRDRFFERIFRADRSVLNPIFWLETAAGLTTFTGRLGETLRRWWIDVRQEAAFGGLLLLPAAATAFFMLWQVIKRRVGRRISTIASGETVQQMSGLSRLMRIAAGLLALLAFILLANVLIAASLGLANLLTSRIEPVVAAIGAIFTPVIFNTGLTYLLCAPRRPEARLVAIDEQAARLLPVLVGLTSLAYALSGQMSTLANVFNLPVSATAGQTALASAVMIVLLGLMLVVFRRQASRGTAEGQSYFLTWFVQVLPIIWVLLGIASVALILGYISLAYFLTGNIFDTALFGIIAALIHYLADAASDSALNPASRLGHVLRNFAGLTEKSVTRLSLMFRTVVDVVLVLISIPALFGIWAVSWITIPSLYASFINGISIGNVTLSPWGLMVALFILGAGIVLTRSITGWLTQRVLSETTIDRGVQTSITTASTYAGYIIAFAIALSAAGLDFSSIAIVAGSLGVGIGFGLQSIVNNFVSGLILLAERPIRVGDWVETDKGDGIVKRINVRSTEIETFDSCTLFIPNSTLITQAVKNWTHRDTVGRISVSVLVEFGSKADDVQQLLLDVVRKQPKILRYPEPSVQLSKFAPQGMEFDIKGHMADVFESPKVASELRIAVARAFEANKIRLAKA